MLSASAGSLAAWRCRIPGGAAALTEQEAESSAPPLAVRSLSVVSLRATQEVVRIYQHVDPHTEPLTASGRWKHWVAADGAATETRAPSRRLQTTQRQKTAAAEI